MKTYEPGYEEEKSKQRLSKKEDKHDDSDILRFIETTGQEKISRMMQDSANQFVQPQADATGRAIFRSAFPNAFVQMKLEISQPGDAHEEQADQVADAVMKGDTQQSQSVLDEKPAAIQKKGDDAALTTTPDFDSQLQTTKGSGSKMDEATKGELEQHTGTDLSGVNIHTGNDAHTMSESISAKAFTHGQDIYFKNGNYNPGTPEGKSLLAHEVAHTVQQGSGIQPKKIQREYSKEELYEKALVYDTPELKDGIAEQYLPFSVHENTMDISAAYEKFNEYQAAIKDSYAGKARAGGQLNKQIPTKEQNEIEEQLDALRKVPAYAPAEVAVPVQYLLFSYGTAGREALMNFIGSNPAEEQSNEKVFSAIRTQVMERAFAKRELLEYLQKTANGETGLIAAGALLVLNSGDKAQLGRLRIDTAALTQRLIVLLELTAMDFDTAFSDEAKQQPEFETAKESIKSTIAGVKGGSFDALSLSVAYQALTMFILKFEEVKKTFLFFLPFRSLNPENNANAIGTILGFDRQVVVWTNFVFESIRDIPARSVSFTTSPQANKSLFEVLDKVTGDMQLKLKFALVKDLAHILFQVEINLYQLITAMNKTSEDDTFFKSTFEKYIVKLKKGTSTVKIIQVLLPTMIKVAKDNPDGFIPLWSKMQEDLSVVMLDVQSIGLAYDAYSMYDFMDKADNEDFDKATVDRYKEVIWTTFGSTIFYLEEYKDDPKKLSEAVDALRRDPFYQEAIEFFQGFAKAEQEYQENRAFIWGIVILLASAITAGWLGGLALAFFEAAEIAGVALTSSALVNVLITEGTVVVVESLGFVLTSRLLNQLVFGKAGDEPFWRDFLKTLATFGILKAVGKGFDLLLGTANLGAKATFSIKMIGGTAVELGSFVGLEYGWNYFVLPEEEQKKMDFWETVTHSAFSLIILKGCLMATSRIPDPVRKYIDAKKLDLLDARSKRLSEKMDKLNHEATEDEIAALQKEAVDIMKYKQDIFRSAAQSTVKDPEMRKMMESTADGIDLRIRDMDQGLAMKEFNIRMESLMGTYTFEGKPEKLEQALNKGRDPERKGTLTKSKTSESSDLYVYSAPGSPDLYFIRKAKSSEFFVTPSATAKALGVDFQTAKTMFWSQAMKDEITSDFSQMGSAETNIIIKKCLEQGWREGMRIPEWAAKELKDAIKKGKEQGDSNVSFVVKRLGKYQFGVIEVPIGQIQRLQPTPKKGKPENYIADMANQMKLNGYDLSESPIEGVEIPGGKIIVFDGHHRLEAFIIIGEKTIPVRVTSYIYIDEAGLRLMLKVGEFSGLFLPKDYPVGFSAPDFGADRNKEIDDQARRFLNEKF